MPLQTWANGVGSDELTRNHGEGRIRAELDTRYATTGDLHVHELTTQDFFDRDVLGLASSLQSAQPILPPGAWVFRIYCLELLDRVQRLVR